MNALSIAAAVLLLVLAGLWAVVGVRGLCGTLPRNRWLGVRSAETLRSDEAFRVANRIAGPGTVGAAAILVLGAVATLAVDSWSLVFAAVALVAALVIIGLVSGIGVRAAAALPVDDAGCSCCSGDAAGHDHGADQGGSDPAADCGTSSCGACSLRGVCAGESSQA